MPLLRYLLIAILSFITIGGFAQKPKVKNYQEVDYKTLHFGFTLGVNFFDFNTYLSDQYRVDLLYADVNNLSPGFNVGIVSELRLQRFLSLRFLPGISFGERKLQFIRDTVLVREFSIESSYLEFPFVFKYSANRLNNFKPYLIGGLNYRLDLAAKKDYNEDDEVLIRLRKSDIYIEAGIGLDFYLKYFKFSTEIKYAMGISDVLVHEPPSSQPQYVNAIDKMKSNLIIISFHFE